MPEEINGLPLHILLVHVVVILVPVSAAAAVLSGIWPVARRRLGIVTPLMALAALIAVPVTGQAGLWLQARVAPTPLIAAHVALGNTLLPWVIAVFVTSVAQWVWFLLRSRAGTPRRRGLAQRVVGLVLLAAVLVASVGSVVQVVQIGESGSRAVWTGRFSETPLG